MKTPNVININLGEFFWSLLEQWKCILIFAVVTAIFVPCSMSLQDNRAAKKKADHLVELASLSDEEKLNRLSDSSRETVVYVLNQARLIKEQEYYDEYSILAKMGESDLPVLHYSWVVSGSADADAITAAYRLLLTDSETSDSVRSALAPDYKDAEDIFINELISVGSEDGIDLIIVLPDGTDVNALKAGIEDRIAGIQNDLTNEFGKHELHVICSEETSVSDADRIAARVLNDNYFKTLKNNYNSQRLSMSDEQRVIVDMMLEGSDYVATPYSNPGISLSKSRMAVGFGAGLLIYVFCYLVFVVFSKKIRSSDTMTETYGIRNLGTASKYIFKGLFFFAHCKLLYKAHRKTTVDGLSLDGIADTVKTSMKHNDLKKLLVVRAGVAKDHYDVSDKLLSKIKGAGFDVKCSDSIPSDSELTEYDSVVVLISYGKMKHSDLTGLTSVCGSYGKKIIGGVWFD